MNGVPFGTLIELDPTVRQISADRLLGGVPRRVLRLGPAGVAALAELRLGTVRTANGAALARRLTDAGLAHPRLRSVGDGAGGASVTVLIPVFGRPRALDTCLTALGDAYPVVVVDDGSPDPAALAKVAAAHGVRLIRRDVNGGPGPARNTGLAAVHTDLVAFLDSDCVPPRDWIERLAGHLVDPAIAAAAPRIVAAPGAPAGARNALDLGPGRGRVAPGTPVSYVPTAALLARREALLAVALPVDDDISTRGRLEDDISKVGGRVFDPALRYGEDVDLIWRLHAAGWRVRYEPSVQVSHVEPVELPGCARAPVPLRRFRRSVERAPPRSVGPAAPGTVVRGRPGGVADPSSGNCGARVRRGHAGRAAGPRGRGHRLAGRGTCGYR